MDEIATAPQKFTQNGISGPTPNTLEPFKNGLYPLSALG